MTTHEKNALGKKLWSIADRLRGAMDPDDFRDYMLAFLFLRYLSDNYETAAKKELGTDFPVLAKDDRRSPLVVWYDANPTDTTEFEKQMRRKIHYTIKPEFLWSSIAELARTQSPELLNQLEKGFHSIENEFRKQVQRLVQ
jgi:type I restriction enzyme M protein